MPNHSSIMASGGRAIFVPDYASYNWTGAPANFNLATNADLGGNSRKSQSDCLLESDTR